MTEPAMTRPETAELARYLADAPYCFWEFLKGFGSDTSIVAEEMLFDETGRVIPPPPPSPPLLKVVKVNIDGTTAFALRMIDNAGDEIDVIAFTDREECRKVQAKVQKLGSPEAIELAAALLKILPKASRIRRTDDQQGTADYATKSHMREWGNDIEKITRSALALTGLPGSKTEVAA